MLDQSVKNRLRWRSRRGLLELDIMLQRFLEVHFEHLPMPELLAYRDLLMLSDNDLLNLINAKTEVTQPQQAAVVAKLCAAHGELAARRDY